LVIPCWIGFGNTIIHWWKRTKIYIGRQSILIWSDQTVLIHSTELSFHQILRTSTIKFLKLLLWNVTIPVVKYAYILYMNVSHYNHRRDFILLSSDSLLLKGKTWKKHFILDSIDFMNVRLHRIPLKNYPVTTKIFHLLPKFMCYL
jgi:hypothetical protein